MRIAIPIPIALVLLLSSCQTGSAPPGGDPDGSSNRSPVAAFHASSTAGAAPLAVDFDASASSDPDGAVVSYEWAFGDGGTAAGVTTSHTYAEPGSYTVTLRVTDDEGASARANGTIVVSADGDPGGDPGDPGGDPGDPGGDPGDPGGDPGDPGGDPGDPGDPGTDPAPEGERRVLESAQGAIDVAPELPDELIGAGVDAALLASQRVGSGSLVVTGTVTQTGPESFAYDPAPADRLRLVLADGRVYEVTFTALEGDLSDDGRLFTLNDHRAAVRVTSNAAAGSLDLALQSVKVGGERQQLVQGSFTDAGGVRWTADVRLQGTYLFDPDSPQLETDDLIQGTLDAPALGVTVDLGRRYTYKTINFVEQVDHQVDHALRWNGSDYRLRSRVFVVFREAKPVDTDEWVIGGELLRDGAVIGRVTATDDPTGLTVWLDLGTERIRLYFFSYL